MGDHAVGAGQRADKKGGTVYRWELSHPKNEKTSCLVACHIFYFIYTGLPCVTQYRQQ